jgi:hypothetical protein
VGHCYNSDGSSGSADCGGDDGRSGDVEGVRVVKATSYGALKMCHA